jgi:hypothetical protein
MASEPQAPTWIEPTGMTAEILLQVAHEWLTPTFPDRTIDTLWWQAENLTGLAHLLHPEDTRLRITCVMKDESSALSESKFLRLNGQPLEGTTQDGLRFFAKQALVSGQITTQRAGASETRIYLDAYEWTIRTDSRPAILWVGSIDADWADHLGNLSLRGPSGFSRGHCRLRGAQYTYYLFNIGAGKQKTVMAVDCSPEPSPRIEVLNREMHYLAFAFGSPAKIGTLFGLDADRRTCGLISGSFSNRDRGRWHDSTVPIFEYPNFWIAPFFKKLCDYGASRDTGNISHFTLGLWYLLSAYRELSFDIRRTELFIGLTHIARHVQDIDALASREKWEQWIDAHRTEISAYPELIDEFVAQIRRAYVPDNETLVRLALAGCGLPMLPPFDAALKQAIDGLRGHIIKPDASQLEELAVLRTLLVALVARTIGYQGAIAGWTRMDKFYFWGRADPNWWPVDGLAEAQAVESYDVTTKRDLPAVRDLWPTFPALTVPDFGPLGVLASFAAALGLKTDGAVLARIIPVPKADAEAPQMFDFVIYDSSSPRNRSILFSIYERDEGKLAVLDWEETEKVLEGERELERFLQEVATSPETAQRVQRIMLAAELEKA